MTFQRSLRDGFHRLINFYFYPSYHDTVVHNLAFSTSDYIYFKHLTDRNDDALLKVDQTINKTNRFIFRKLKILCPSFLNYSFINIYCFGPYTMVGEEFLFF
ncbi:dubious [Schizosaccharomyces pombe]|uniref:Uncharacterized protein C1002.20 n=1 Tax=Schizosaccharomyces pombe (strain 972 / ATCC 24843) TaxID=284812 RepID=YIZK_SCHPO|nr:uncharacterized protein SPAC1002.20 [Schizosaccharomyces pombe]Q9C121.1 RecName: Full=Uncharacterized protein C1002.20 [Schizosaccharomyces pombe 972h-]CAC34481.1 sequence orphan [Schizosaccharomyces pombe]|eukprot:NP_593501.1 uncharacterized protein SPAC1002.20 [Schizosaccharomyces pombe]